jgi:hypothetical protein
VHAQGAAVVADPRLPAATDQGVWLIVAEDGTWHRPLTTLELAALQGFPTTLPDGAPLVLAGRSQERPAHSGLGADRGATHPGGCREDGGAVDPAEGGSWRCGLTGGWSRSGVWWSATRTG